MVYSLHKEILLPIILLKDLYYVLCADGETEGGSNKELRWVDSCWA